MNIQVLLIVIAVGIALLLALWRMKTRAGKAAAFASRELLFTPEERSFLGVLEQALDSRYRVFGKVRLGDIIKPAKGLDAGRRTATQNRINQKHLDFVICTANKLALVGVLELDDRSHGRPDRGERDEFVDRALASAGIPLLRFPARQGYALQEVRTKLEELMRATSRSCAVSASPAAAAPVSRAGEVRYPYGVRVMEVETDGL
jgi:very-short-patch-repair endonuclease